MAAILSPEKLAKFRHECLLKHNELRQQHGVKPLQRDPTLDVSAQDWAEALLGMDVLRNSPLSTIGKVGESVSLRKSALIMPDFSGSEVVEDWKKDTDYYDFDSGEGTAVKTVTKSPQILMHLNNYSPRRPTGNFTQMVWASTTHVGFGMACSNNKCVAVAHYRPPGNIKGCYVKNVFPNLSFTGPSAKRPSQHYLNRCRRAKKKQMMERYSDDKGRNFTLRKDISDYIDNEGIVVEKIHEIRVQGDQYVLLKFAELMDYTDEESEMEFQESIKDLPPAAQQEAITAKQFAEDMVTVHNTYRSRHGSSTLCHNRELTEMAKKWAETLVKQQELTSSNYAYRGSSLGENLAMRTIYSAKMIDIKVCDVVAYWYSEAKNYDYSLERKEINTVGNFTQLVWRSTTMLGAAKAIQATPEGVRVVVVAFYYPPGNVLGGFLKNVPPPDS